MSYYEIKTIFVANNETFSLSPISSENDPPKTQAVQCSAMHAAKAIINCPHLSSPQLPSAPLSSPHLPQNKPTSSPGLI